VFLLLKVMDKKNKLRILMCSEASFINSGFGKYAYEFLSRLHKTNKYVIGEFASYGFVNDPRDKNIAWTYYANAVHENDPRYQEYMSRSDNQFGRWRFEKVLLDFKPDVVVDVRDYWMTHYQPISPLRSYFHHVLMPTVDSAPQQEEWLDVFLKTDAIFTYSDWGAEVLKNQTNNNINYIATATPGVNLDIFYVKDKKKVRSLLNMQDDAFVIGSVMRNQKRKLIPELMVSLKNLLRTLEQQNSSRKVYLYLHTTYPDMGWDIPELLNQYEISNNVLFTYFCKHCNNIEASTFSGPKKVCRKCLNKSSVFPSVSNGVSEEQLSDIYNTFDLYVQYAICEGLGIPQVEAGACGIPIATVNYSAMIDIINKLEAYPIKVKSYFKELETKAIRAYPDNDDLVSAIILHMNKCESDVIQHRVNIRNLTTEHYSWDKIIKIWENYFDALQFRANWSKPLPLLTKPDKIKENPSHFATMASLCNNYLQDANLLSSFRFLNLLQNADYEFSNISPTQISAASIKDMYNHTNTIIDNNNISEKARIGYNGSSEDFIQYAHMKNNT
jgi:glycosyltransferase involved in cell wall biosynthesis